MDFSIIIPNYNTKKLTANCIKSIIEWTKDVTFEIIVVDNGSSDGSVSYLTVQFPKIKVIAQKTNTGFGNACNIGAKNCRGQYLCLLNSDTIFLTNVLKEAQQKLQKEKKVGVLAPQLIDVDGKIQPSAGHFPTIGNLLAWTFFIDDIPLVNRYFPAYHLANQRFYLKEKNFDWVQAACWLVRKDVFLRAGGFDKQYFMYAEDIDFCYRTKLMGYRHLYDPAMKIYHIDQGKITAYKVAGEYQGLYQYFKKHRPAWLTGCISLIIRINRFIRMLIFGILLDDAEKRQIYRQAK